MANKGDAVKLETSGNQEEIVPELDVSLKKRKVGEPDINPSGASSLTADTPKRRESEQGSSANDISLAGCLHAYDMVGVDEWRGGLVRSRLCVRQFKAEGLWDDLFAGTPDTFFIQCLLAKAASWKDFGILVIGISVAFMHTRTDEEIYVKVPSGIKR